MHKHKPTLLLQAKCSISSLLKLTVRNEHRAGYGQMGKINNLQVKPETAGNNASVINLFQPPQHHVPLHTAARCMCVKLWIEIEISSIIITLFNTNPSPRWPHTRSSTAVTLQLYRCTIQLLTSTAASGKLPLFEGFPLPDGRKAKLMKSFWDS